MPAKAIFVAGESPGLLAFGGFRTADTRSQRWGGFGSDLGCPSSSSRGFHESQAAHVFCLRVMFGFLDPIETEMGAETAAAPATPTMATSLRSQFVLGCHGLLRMRLVQSENQQLSTR